jgi:hypothetical protein
MTISACFRPLGSKTLTALTIYRASPSKIFSLKINSLLKSIARKDAKALATTGSTRKFLVVFCATCQPQQTPQNPEQLYPYQSAQASYPLRHLN